MKGNCFSSSKKKSEAALRGEGPVSKLKSGASAGIITQEPSRQSEERERPQTAPLPMTLPMALLMVRTAVTGAR